MSYSHNQGPWLQVERNKPLRLTCICLLYLETFLSRKLLSYVVVVLQASPVIGQYLLRAAHIG